MDARQIRRRGPKRFATRQIGFDAVKWVGDGGSC
jgi:hypothetical protein